MSFGVLRRAATSVASGIVVIALTPALAAQSGSSTIAGLVRDATGAPIPGASITGERRPPRRGVQPLNRANYHIPGFTLGAADFGVISSARSARIVQLGARLTF